MTNSPQIVKTQTESEGAKSFTTPKYALWDTDFGLVIMKQKIQEEPLTLLLTCQ